MNEWDQSQEVHNHNVSFTRQSIQIYLFVSSFEVLLAILLMGLILCCIFHCLVYEELFIIKDPSFQDLSLIFTNILNDLNFI